MGSSSFGDLLMGAGFALVLVGAGCAADTTGSDHAGAVVGAPMGGAPVGGISGGLTPSGGVTPGAGSDGVVPDGTMPCEVSSVVQARCHRCHGAMPIGGAPMSLVTLADFHRDYTAVSTTPLAGRAYKMYELARIRINREQGTTPMPQGSPLQGSELSTLSSWLTSGAPAGAACGANGGAGSGTIGTPPLQAGMGGVAGAGGVTGGSGTSGTTTGGPAMIDDQCDQPGAFEPLVPNSPEETCYDFRTHGRSGAGDTSKFNIPTGETYNQFYFEIPWEPGAEATRFGTDYDNREVLHHWLMFGQQLGMAPGTVEPGVLGTTLFTDAELISGWAVGGCTTTYPEDVGFKLPTTGVIMVQWHHYNYTGSTTQDASAAQICTVPGGTRPNTAGVTFLGTELISIPVGTTGEASGTCTNDSGGPITIFTFTPHMHEIGINMKSEVMRAAGGSEVVFDMPFQFDYQTNYMMNPYVVLQPGDRIKSTCTYRNETLGTVGFGQSTKAEMCYQFAISYPYGALNNGVPSLIGATNTCW